MDHWVEVVTKGTHVGRQKKTPTMTTGSDRWNGQKWGQEVTNGTEGRRESAAHPHVTGIFQWNQDGEQGKKCVRGRREKIHHWYFFCFFFHLKIYIPLLY